MSIATCDFQRSMRASRVQLQRFHERSGPTNLSRHSKSRILQILFRHDQTLAVWGSYFLREEKRRREVQVRQVGLAAESERRNDRPAAGDGQPAWPTKHTETCSFRPKPKPVIAFRPGHPAAHPTIPTFPRYCLIISRGFNERDARNQFSRARASCPLSARLCPNW